VDIKKLANPDKLIIVEFWSTICILCEKIRPFLTKLEKIYNEKFSIVRVDAIDDYSTAEYYNIKELPTFIFIKDNELIFRMNGFKSESNFEKTVRTYL